MRHTTIIFMLLLVGNLYPAWLTNVPNTLTQPDGTTINVFYSGDEYHNWVHNKDNYTMLRDPLTGYICWAKAENGELVSTGSPVHLHTPQSLNLQPNENISETHYKQKRQQLQAQRETSPTRTPTIGIINQLVVFIRFADDAEFTQQVAYYDEMFNDFGTGESSLEQYYYDASYNQLTVKSHFFPLQYEDTVTSYQDIYPRSYFLPYNAVTNPNGYTNDGWERYEREQDLLARAILSISSEVHPSLNIDSDNDQYVDNVNFVIRGREGDWNTLLWPHRWSIWYGNLMINGKWVYDFNFNIENHMNISGVTVLAHEFGHSLGAPDYYRYNFSSSPVGVWDIMETNTTPPQSMSAYTKWFYMGWVDPIHTVNTSGYYTLYPNTISPDQHALRIPSPNSATEYFIVEYRSNETGLLDSALPGSGLVVWRINSSVAGDGNSDGPPDEVYVYRYNGTPYYDGSLALAYFSAQSGRTAINDHTNPSAFLSTGQPGGLNISDIGEAGETITFFVNVDFNQQSALNITPSNFNFGTIAVNQSSSPQSFVVTNTSGGVVTVNSIAVIGADESDFTLDATDLPWSLTPSETRSFTATFAPASSGVKTAYISVAPTAGGATQYASLSGTGYSVGQAIPYTQDFNTAYDLQGIGWRESISTYSGIREYCGVDGTNGVALNVRTNIPTQHVITPTIATINANTALCFAYRILTYPLNHSYNGELSGATLTVTDVVYIDVSTTGPTGTYTTRSVINQSNHTSSADFSTLTIPLATYANQNVNIRFLATMTSGNWAFILDNVAITDQWSEHNEVLTPATTALKGNYPNPFNPETTIQFALTRKDRVNINIYSINGQLVRSLVNAVYGVGAHSAIWNGRDNNGRFVSSGVYFYRMRVGEYTATKKMLLLK